MKALWLLILLAGIAFLGCTSDDEKDTPPPPCTNCADSLVALGNTALEQALFGLINGPDPEQPEDIDFSISYGFYTQALGYDAGHQTAHFGVGMLEVMMMTRDPEVQSLFDWVKAFIDSGTYFEVPPPALRVPDGPSPILRLSDLSLPVLAPASIARRMSGTLDDDPQMSDVQNLLLTELLPRVETALDHLGRVTGNSAFEFTITPRMQGDNDEDEAELDLTEVRATIAGLHVIRALCQQICAYQFDFNAYDGPGMQSAFSQGSSYGRLRGDGVSRMQAARSAWLSAIDHVNSAVDFLEHETDNQADDIIRIDPYDDLTQRDLDTLKRYLPMIEQSLNSSQVFHLDTDDNDATPLEPITISLFNFFDSPVNDFKDLFPPYTVTLDTQAIETYHVYGDSLVTAIVHVNQSDFYSWTRIATYRDGEEQYSYDQRPFDAPVWDAAFDAIVNAYRQAPYLSVSLNSWSFVEAGTDTLNGSMYWNHEVGTRFRFIPVITWQAETFNDWHLPDATISGLFPLMTEPEFKRVFNLTAEDWRRETVWRLW